MNKKEVQQRVLQFGKPLDLDKFSWDKDTCVFSTNENNLVIDFNGMNNCTFRTGYNCTFDTGDNCTFNTYYDCTFNTCDNCTFKTGSYCIFDTGYNCTFKTGSHCTFKTSSYCTFNAYSYCTFNTGSYCVFNTGSYCTFNVGSKCVIVRRDVFEVIEPKEGQIIKLNEYKVKGYTIVNEHIITIDGKEIKLSEESYNELKRQLN
jgi:hypothetical protein